MIPHKENTVSTKANT